MGINIEQKNISVAGIATHYRQAGTGPVVILLHPSPRSGQLMEPLMGLLAANHMAIAPDTPGYGQSSALPKRPQTMADYLPWLHQFIQTVAGNKPVQLYGSATGAQLAIAYSLAYPQQVRHLFADNCAHFSEADCADILANYFPDLSPQADGSHFLRIAQLVADSCLYFPWYKKEETCRIASVLPPQGVLDAIAADYVRAGAHYADAYIAAFKHERAAHVQALQVPTTIFKWLGSPILRHMERLLAYSMPGNINIIETPAEIGQRLQRMAMVIM